MNVLVINGHPRENSFSESLTDAYCEGANESGVTIRRVDLRKLSFNPNVDHGHGEYQLTEPDLRAARADIVWADHIVFIYPTWWGTMPALLKAFLDRVLVRGFAFDEIEGGTGYAPLLRGKTAQLITTMDTPYFVYNLIYRSPGNNAMRRATLEFCGFEVGKTLHFGPVKTSTVAQRRSWLDRARAEGRKLATGALTPSKLFSIKLMSWLKAIRLQFYPMTFVAYMLGAHAAAYLGHPFSRQVFWIGYGWLFFLEVATVLINDFFDYSSDKVNRSFGPFTGGSRVIVDRLLSFREFKWGIFSALLLSCIFFTWLLLLPGTSTAGVLSTALVLLLLALGYTAPPLKLVYRGLGELTVGITHSFAVIICGFIFQKGNLDSPTPWALGLPLFLSILPSIIMAGIPDYEADKSVSKRTIAVLYGRRSAAKIALAFAWLAAATVILFQATGILNIAFRGLPFLIVPHALILTLSIKRYLEKTDPANRIDTLMIAALTYLVWFALIPLINIS